MKAADVPEAVVLATIRHIEKTEGRWSFISDIESALPQFRPKVVLAKLRSMVKRKQITGCTCGCRGDFEVKE